jgi:hypothetical protein
MRVTLAKISAESDFIFFVGDPSVGSSIVRSTAAASVSSTFVDFPVSRSYTEDEDDAASNLRWLIQKSCPDVPSEVNRGKHLQSRMITS